MQDRGQDRGHVIYVVMARGLIRHEPMAWRMTRAEADAFAAALEAQGRASRDRTVNGDREQGYAVDGPFWWANSFTVHEVAEAPPCAPPSGPPIQSPAPLSEEELLDLDRTLGKYTSVVEIP